RRPTVDTPIRARNLRLRCSDLAESFIPSSFYPDTRDFGFGLTSGKRLWSRAYSEGNAAPPNGRRKQWADARRRCRVRDERERRDAARTKEHGNKRALVTADISPERILAQQAHPAWNSAVCAKAFDRCQLASVGTLAMGDGAVPKEGSKGRRK